MASDGPGSVTPGTSRREILLALLAVVALVTLAHFGRSAHGGGQGQGLLRVHRRGGLRRQVDLEKEANFTTWFSSTLLLAAAFLLARIGAAERQAGRRFWMHWIVLALVFVGLSIDETAMLHESLTRPVRAVVPAGGVLTYAWVVVALPVVVVFGLGYLRFLVALPWATRIGVIAAASLFVGGALGLEMVEGVIAETLGEDGLAMTLARAVEEVMEMTGMIIFIWTLHGFLLGARDRATLAVSGPSRLRPTAAYRSTPGYTIDARPESSKGRRVRRTRVVVSPSAGRRLRLAAVGLAVIAAGCADLASTPIALPSPPAAGAPGALARPLPGAATPTSTLYVDQQLGRPSCDDYAPERRACGGGGATAYQSLEDASSAATPGTAVVVREGTFTRQFAPARSGSPDGLITFRSHPGETVTFTGIADEPALLVRDRSYLAFVGFTVVDVQGWGRLENAQWIAIRGNRFKAAQARGSRGGLKLVRSHHNAIIDNTFEEGNDNLVIQESDRNLVQGNVFRWGRHSLLSIRCGNLNVVRRNWFTNERQKAAEIYDCEGVSDAPLRLDATRRNLFEGNVFALTRAAGEPHRYNGIQYSGQFGIVRRNVFHDNRGGAIRFHVYAQEALHNYGHRVYQNTFFLNSCFAVSSSAGGGGRFGDTVLDGNLFYKNSGCAGQPAHTGVENSSAVVLRRNALLDARAESPFRDEASRDLRLRPASAMVDAGGFLARTVGAGSGTALRVDDVKWFFFDPAGLDEAGADLIQLEGDTARARIVGIDYVAGILTLDRALTWAAGQSLALAYEGRAPDMGAHEAAADISALSVWPLARLGGR